MYPVKLGFNAATACIRKLLGNECFPEALVSGMFTVEKTLRRTLRQLIVSAGFSSKHADRIMKGFKGIESLKEAWEIYDPANTKLTEIIESRDWNLFKEVAGMRNKMVHGERVYELETCRNRAEETLLALDRLKTSFDVRYGYSGWANLSPRIKSRLHVDPKVTIET